MYVASPNASFGDAKRRVRLLVAHVSMSSRASGGTSASLLTLLKRLGADWPLPAGGITPEQEALVARIRALLGGSRAGKRQVREEVTT